MLYVIICDGIFDQICEGKPNMERERRDLKGMGFIVKVKPCSTWHEAETIEQRMKQR